MENPKTPNQTNRINPEQIRNPLNRPSSASRAFSFSEPRKKDHSRTKNFILDAIAIILAFTSGYAYLQFLNGNWSFVVFIVLFGIWITASSFRSLLVQKWKELAIGIILEAIAFLSFFYASPLAILAPALGIMLLFFLWGEKIAKSQINNFINFNFGRAVRPKMAKMLTGIAFASILIYIPYWNGNEIFISEKRFDIAYQAFADVAEGFSSGLDFSSNIENFTRGIVKLRLQQNKDFQNLSPVAQDRAIEEATRELIGAVSKNSSFSITPETSTSNAVYNYIKSTLNSWRERLGNSFLAVWAVAIFLLVRSLGTIFTFITFVIGYLIHEALLAMGIAEVRKEQAVKERIGFTD